jgi:putative transposase
MGLPLIPNRRWSLDFVADQPTDGRRFRIMTVVDGCPRECRALIAGTSLSGGRVNWQPCSMPAAKVVSDSGTAFPSNAVLKFVENRKFEWHDIAPGRPIRNAFIESSSARLRAELLNAALLPSRHHARVTLAVWHTDDNTKRPHARPGWQTPAAFTPQRGLTLRKPRSSATAPVAHPAHIGKAHTRRLAHAG